MSDLYLDYDTWDLAIEDGDLVFIDTNALLARQAVVMTMRAFRGEWFKDINYGVPWVENDNNSVAILGKTPKAVFDSYIREAILSNEEILSIISYTSTLDQFTGKITIDTKLEILDGSITISEEVS